MSEMVTPIQPDEPAEPDATPAVESLLGRRVRVNWEVVAWAVLVVLTMVTRLWFLGDRAMSHDESLHTYYSWRLFNGEGYVHDPMMHGPLLYHLTALIYFLFGVSDYTARLISVFLGLGLVLTPLLLRRYLGPVGSWVTGAILVLSPTVLYYSRYIRHDIHVEFFIVLMAAALFRYLDTRRASWMVVIGIGAACAITSAEMSYIMGCILLVFVVLAILAERVGKRGADWMAVGMGILGLGLLIFAVFAETNHLGNVDKGTLLRTGMQFGLLGSGFLLALSLGIGLLSRFDTTPVRLTERTGRTLRDILAPAYFDPDGGAVQPPWLMVAGVILVAVGFFLTPALMQMLSGSVVCTPGIADARCVLAGLVSILLPALGFFLVLFGMAGAFVRMGSIRANLLTFFTGLGFLALGVGTFWYQRHQIKNPDGSLGAYIAPEMVRTPQLMYLVDGLVIAAGLIVIYGLIGWLLERDEERGLAEALAAIPTWALTLAVVAFLVIYVLLFTTFFSNPKGIYGFWDSAKYWWDQHEVVRGDQPWYYYAVFDPMYEFLPFLLALAAIAIYSLRPALRIWRGNDQGTDNNPEPGARIFVPMLITWSIGVFWIFSWAGEKMPWLIVHFVVPQAFLAGRLVSDGVAQLDWEAFRARGWQLAGLLVLLALTAGAALLPFAMAVDGAQDPQQSLWVLGLIVVAVLAYAVFVSWRALGNRQSLLVAGLTAVVVIGLMNVRYSLMANYVNAENAKEYIVYAHGTADDKLVYNTLRDLQERIGVDQPLKIIYDDDVSWPFTWYFRNSDWADASYVGSKPSGGITADVALVGSANYSNFAPYLGNKRYVSTEFTRMWWPNEGYKGLTLERLKNAILDPKERRNWLEILLFRRYTKDPQADVPEDKSLTDWYHHSNMRMYVKKDLIEKAWPLVQSRPEWLVGVEKSQSQAEVPELTLAHDGAFPATVESKSLSGPKDLTLGPDGTVYVVDHGNYRVVAYNPDGSVKGVVGDGQFVNPPTDTTKADEPTAWGIGVAPDGTLYVADTWKHQVVQFDKDGKRLAAWGVYGNPTDKTTDLGSFYGPRDVAVGPDGMVYVTDTGNSRILIFDPATGKPTRAIVDAGPDLGPFLEPTSLAFDPETGELYVADLWNRRIVRFKRDLTPDIAWDVEGWEGQEAAHKGYLAVGPNGVVVASDPSGQRVFIYSRDGKALGTLNLPMDEQGLDQPIGVAVDDQGRILVAASNSGQVTRYAPADVILKAAGAAAPAAGGDQLAPTQPIEPSPSPTAQEIEAQPIDPNQPTITRQGPMPNPPPGATMPLP